MLVSTMNEIKTYTERGIRFVVHYDEFRVKYPNLSDDEVRDIWNDITEGDLGALMR
jgi:hypothetical protein